MRKPTWTAWLLVQLVQPLGAADAPAAATSVMQSATGDHNTTIGIVNGHVTIIGIDPATVASTVQTFTDVISATVEARALAEARAAEMGAKLGFTTLAV